MKKFLRNNGLSIALFAFFLASELALTLVGQAHYNHDRLDHNQQAVDYRAYVCSSEFMEATMENWESEFLQMFAYVLFTTFLYQKGSSESKPIDGFADVDADPRAATIVQQTPWPVKKGGLILKIYENSLSLTLLGLFALSFLLHGISGAEAYNNQQTLHQAEPISTLEYFSTSQFWFESLQNWQSEFFSIGVMVVLSIILRQRGSPESKPVAMPHTESPAG
ncbi:MAG TPA: DUF6766 family protein [Spongiibacteraceae bacterium]|nr:DUF6766 family protein [Spongiibacteraceae bacterium]